MWSRVQREILTKYIMKFENSKYVRNISPDSFSCRKIYNSSKPSNTMALSACTRSRIIFNSYILTFTPGVFLKIIMRPLHIFIIIIIHQTIRQHQLFIIPMETNEIKDVPAIGEKYSLKVYLLIHLTIIIIYILLIIISFVRRRLYSLCQAWWSTQTFTFYLAYFLFWCAIIFIFHLNYIYFHITA